MKKTQLRYEFSVNMPYSQCHDLYMAAVKYVVVTDRGGQRLQIDKHHLKQFLTPVGIKGRFLLVTTDRHKFVEIKKIK